MECKNENEYMEMLPNMREYVEKINYLLMENLKLKTINNDLKIDNETFMKREEKIVREMKENIQRLDILKEKSQNKYIKLLNCDCYCHK